MHDLAALLMPVVILLLSANGSMLWLVYRSTTKLNGRCIDIERWRTGHEEWHRDQERRNEQTHDRLDRRIEDVARNVHATRNTLQVVMAKLAIRTRHGTEEPEDE